jgi:hypothetical protein
MLHSIETPDAALPHRECERRFSHANVAVERSDDAPLVSDGFQPARDAIATRVHKLLDGYERDDARSK